jgi:hypothetical protein
MTIPVLHIMSKEAEPGGRVAGERRITMLCNLRRGGSRGRGGLLDGVGVGVRSRRNSVEGGGGGGGGSRDINGDRVLSGHDGVSEDEAGR